MVILVTGMAGHDDEQGGQKPLRLLYKEIHRQLKYLHETLFRSFWGERLATVSVGGILDFALFAV